MYKRLRMSNFKKFFFFFKPKSLTMRSRQKEKCGTCLSCIAKNVFQMVYYAIDFSDNLNVTEFYRISIDTKMAYKSLNISSMTATKDE